MFVVALLLCLVFLTPNIRGQSQPSTTEVPKSIDLKDAKDAGPVVQGWEPKSGAINSIIELRGLRLYPAEFNKSKAFFIQNGVEIPARTSGGSSVTNDENNGAQTLDVIVPEEAVPGTGQIVVQANGLRSVPVTVTITEWKLPIIKRVTPTRGAPGTLVQIECDGFHINDEIEITDADGQPVRFDSGGSSICTAFGIPKDAAEGVWTVRIGNVKYGKGQYTEPFTVTVTNDPLPLELVAAWMKPVAPGQWLELQANNSGPLEHSELTEVAFKQAGRTIVVATPQPFRPHVEVPSALSAGEVQLQMRTWRNGRPSEWSEPVIVQLADKPLAPSVAALRLEEGSWVHLWPGPDRPSSFSVTAGDEVVLNGLWPVADASKLKVLLVRPGEVITLSASELDGKADWFSDVRVRLPESLEVGEWRMIVSSETDGTHDEVPIVITVVGKSMRSPA
jgi:hypothetical protein